MQRLLILAMITLLNLSATLSRTQDEFIRDDRRAYAEADNELNKVYQQILVKYKARTKFIKDLKNAQRRWIEFRDAEYEMTFPESNSHLDRKHLTEAQAIYLLKLTVERTNTLCEILDQNSGGTITCSDGYTIHTFTTSGTFSCFDSGFVEVLVVAGGGGGGGTIRGGGGGGGVVYCASYFASGDIRVTVGAGGAGGAPGETSGSNGENSSFGSLIAIGGGSGDAGTGGSGGGANRVQTAGGIGTDGQGNNGGASVANDNTCGGGGGAGAIGGAGSISASGKGGNGLRFSISGSSVYYGGGGGGGVRYGSGRSPGRGGSGGGGNGGITTDGESGLANTGGGGGAGGFAGGGYEGYRAGGDGGSGIVIVRYRTK
jgi:uncharacterized protein YecT (DUF1311 family)